MSVRRCRIILHRLCVAAVAAAGLALLSGCAGEVITCRAHPGNIGLGVPYYLPKHLAKVTVIKRGEGKEGKFDAILGVPPPVADPAQAYVAVPRKKWFRSSVVDIRTSPEGLLSSAFVSSERRNANISDNLLLSETFTDKEGFKRTAVVQNRAINDAKTAILIADLPASAVVFQAIFDSESCEDVAGVNESLAKYKLRIEAVGLEPGAPPAVTPERVPGLLFRPAVLRPIYVRRTADDTILCSLGPETVSKATFNLPLRTGIFAKYSHAVEMQEGVLTGYFARRPSELAGLFQVTAETAEDAGRVVGAFIAPIAAAIQVKKNPSDSSTATGDRAAAEVIDEDGDGVDDVVDDDDGSTALADARTSSAISAAVADQQAAVVAAAAATRQTGRNGNGNGNGSGSTSRKQLEPILNIDAPASLDVEDAIPIPLPTELPADDAGVPPAAEGTDAAPASDATTGHDAGTDAAPAVAPATDSPAPDAPPADASAGPSAKAAPRGEKPATDAAAKEKPAKATATKEKPAKASAESVKPAAVPPAAAAPQATPRITVRIPADENKPLPCNDVPDETGRS